MLVILGFWRHVRHHWPLTYEPTLWSVVFRLGMSWWRPRSSPGSPARPPGDRAPGS